MQRRLYCDIVGVQDNAERIGEYLMGLNHVKIGGDIIKHSIPLTLGFAILGAIFWYIYAKTRTSSTHRYPTPPHKIVFGPFTKAMIATYITIILGFFIYFTVLAYFPDLFFTFDGINIHMKPIAIVAFLLIPVIGIVIDIYVDRREQ